MKPKVYETGNLFIDLILNRAYFYKDRHRFLYCLYFVERKLLFNASYKHIHFRHWIKPTEDRKQMKVALTKTIHDKQSPYIFSVFKIQGTLI